MLSQSEAFARIFEKAKAAEAPPVPANPKGKPGYLPIGGVGPVWIAGGAAADYNKCGDIDVWFGNCAMHHAEKFLESFEYYEKVDKGIAKSYDENTHASIVGDAYDPLIGKPIQVLVVGHNNIEQLLESFDINSHMWGVDSDQKLWSCKHTPITYEHPKIINQNPKTFQRYVKICQRYGFTPDPEVLKTFTPKQIEPTFSGAAANLKSLAEDMKKYGWLPPVKPSKKKYIPNSLGELYGDDAQPCPSASVQTDAVYHLGVDTGVDSDISF